MASERSHRLMRLSHLSRKALLAGVGLGFPAIERARDLLWRGEKERVVLLSFDVDYQRDEEALPRVLETLRAWEVRASFACVGVRVERNPGAYEPLLSAGHELVNHSYTHPDNRETRPDRSWREMTRAERREEVERAQDAFERALGVRPLGFRLPHFGNVREPDEAWHYEMLASAGLRYSSSKLDFAVGGRELVVMEPSGVVEVPVTTCPYHPYTAMDSYHVFRSGRLIYRAIHRLVGFERSVDRALERAARRGLLVNVYVDPLDMTGGVLIELLRRALERGWRFETYSGLLKARGFLGDQAVAEV